METMEERNFIPGEQPLDLEDEKSMRNHKRRLIEEKAKLATELHKT